MSALRRSPLACRCGAPVAAAEHGVCGPCDLRNVYFALVLAGFLRPTHPAEANLLVRTVDGKADGEPMERARRRQPEASPC